MIATRHGGLGTPRMRLASIGTGIACAKHGVRTNASMLSIVHATYHTAVYEVQAVLAVCKFKHDIRPQISVRVSLGL